MLEMIHRPTGQLPNNVNGHRTTHTCELCGFEPKTKNKYREKQDHLVMKHFKEKIDKIFPHCRPYACPTSDCGFTGKDKQALLRHYTGKHGILEKYLREALQAKGLPYERDHVGSKRKHSTNSNHDSNGTSKAKKQIIQTTQLHQQHNSTNNTGNNPPHHHTTIIDTRDMLPKSPVPVLQNGNGNAGQTTISNGNGNLVKTQVTFNRPNNEELRKEIEGLMASLHPQPQQEVVTTCNVPQSGPPQHVIANGSGSIKVVTSIPSLPTAPVPVSTCMVTSAGSAVQQAASIPSIVAHTDDKQKVILSSKLPNHHHVTLQQNQNNSQPPSSVVSLIKRSEAVEAMQSGKTIQVSSGQTQQFFMTNGSSGKGHQTIVLNQNGQTLSQNGQTIHIPELILPQGAVNGDSNGHFAIPIEVIQVAGSTAGGTVEIINGNNVVIENEEVMWGAGSTLGPNVIVETNEALPVTYIEGVGDVVYSAAGLDNIDYDYLYPVTSGTTTNVVTSVRNAGAVSERQLEFNTF